MEQLLSELVVAREETYKRTGWSRTFVEDLSSVWNSDRIVAHKALVFGDHSVTDMSGRAKHIQPSDGLIGGYGTGELAAGYLLKCRQSFVEAHPELPPKALIRRRVPWASSWESVLAQVERSAPLVFVPPVDRGGEWAYVDIKSCYGELMNVGTLDMMYSGLGGDNYLLWGVLELLRFDELNAIKPVRTAAYGISLKKSFKMRKFGVEVDTGSLLPNYSPGLTAYVLDTINAIAQEGIRLFNSPMWVTDAMMVRPDQVDEVVRWLRESWGLVGVVKHSGEGYLSGFNRWQIEDRVAGREGGVDQDYETPLRREVSLEDIEWLKATRFRLLGRQRLDVPWVGSVALDVEKAGFVPVE